MNVSQFQATVPVVWLLGKVQSGKTSIVRALTGCTDAEIGNGYKPTTRTARVFDFPETAPLIRFLDTRGLGEVDYDPTPDIVASEQQSHLVLVVMKALDQQQAAVLNVVKTLRRRRPECPILIAQTTLHQAYRPGMVHPQPYPFDDVDPMNLQSAGAPSDLIRSLAQQRSLLDGVPGTGRTVFVPLDFTHPEDGLLPHDYGLPALMSALRAVAPSSIVVSVHETLNAANDVIAARAHPVILGHATAAAAAGLVPVAGAVAVPGIQIRLLHGLATSYGVPWDGVTVTQFAGCLGTSTVATVLSSFGIRELVKLLPGYGQTAGAVAAAASSFAATFAVGKAAAYFLGQRRIGLADPEGVQQIYGEALQRAFVLSRDRPDGPPHPDKNRI